MRSVPSSSATVAILAAVALLACDRPAEAPLVPGTNPHPVTLRRPAAAALSPVAELGAALFADPRLSGSGTIACATCHNPGHLFGPPDDRAVQLGGPDGRDQGARAVPSLRYGDRIPNFGIGPEVGEEDIRIPPATLPAGGRSPKTAGSAPAAAAVPHGGYFWDGRANTLQGQAIVPLFNPVEMANRSVEDVAHRLRAAGYAAQLERLFSHGAVATPARLVDQAMFAVARFEIEDSSFHPYSSKYDAWLEGKATLTPPEARGLAVFEDPRRGNCAACHLDRPDSEGHPPLFTDFEYEALAVPRNTELEQNRDPRFFDLGLCGPIRTDLASRPEYCGLFRTPSLRNVATRKVFFHNGRYHTLADVLRFYNLRAVAPDSIYPHDSHGSLLRFDDLPPRYRGNVDTLDAPFDRHPGDPPPMTVADLQDLLAFLQTLTDGYRSAGH